MRRSAHTLARATATVADAVRVAADAAFEPLAGIQSRGFTGVAELGIEPHDRVWYEPSAWIPVMRTFQSLGIARGDVLLEYGAGKGRVLVLARAFRFARIVGIEASPELAQTAIENLARARTPRRCRDVSVEVADAARWTVPEDVSVIYMNCPFTGEVFEAAIGSLLSSYDRAPRRVRVVYNNPFEHNFLLATGRFQPVAVAPCLWPAPWDWYTRKLGFREASGRAWQDRRVIVVYELLPAGTPTRPLAGAWGRYRSTGELLPRGYDPIVVESSQAGGLPMRNFSRRGR